MDKPNSNPQALDEVHPLEIDPFNSLELNSPTQVARYVSAHNDMLSLIPGELKIPVDANFHQSQESTCERDIYGPAEREVFHNKLESLFKLYIKAYHADESSDPPNTWPSMIELYQDRRLLKTLSQLRRGKNGSQCTREELMLEFGASLAHLHRRIEFEDLWRSARNHSQRYDELWAISDLNDAISLYEQALVCVAPNDPFFKDVVLALDLDRSKRYKHLGDWSDLPKSIECLSALATRHCNEHHIMTIIWNRLGVSHMYLFESLGFLGNIEQGIECLKRAVSLAGENNQEQFVYISNLASSYQARFTKLGNVSDLNKAITLLEKTIVTTPIRHDKFPGYLSHLGMVYTRRLEKTGAVEDLMRAVDCLSVSVRLFPRNDPYLPFALQFLAYSLRRRCMCTGNPDDMDQAIECNTQAILLIPSGRPDWTDRLGDLGQLFSDRFKLFQNVDDINRSIECLVLVISYTPSGHPDMPSRLDTLGVALIRRFERLGEFTDIEMSVECLQKAVQSTTAAHPNMPSRLNNLGLAQNKRFNYSGDIEDNYRAVECHEKALELTPEGHESLRYYLFGLGTAYLGLFNRLGHVELGDRAIRSITRATTMTCDVSEKPSLLAGLARAYINIYERLGQVEDLDRAIHYQTQAVELSPVGHADRSQILGNLGRYFQIRFESSQDLRVLDKAIACGREAAELSPVDNYAVRATNFAILGDAYERRFKVTRNANDINMAVELLEQAVTLTPEDHTARPMRLSSLGRTLASQFSVLHDIAVLNKSIEVLAFAVSLASTQDALFSGILYNLGHRYLERFEHLDDLDALFQGVHCFRLAAESPFGHPEIRSQAAHINAGLIAPILPSQSLGGYQVIIDMIPQLVWLGSSIDTRYKSISQIGRMIQDAVTVAMKAESYMLALEWLEQGRSVVWNQMLQLRSPLDELNSHHPELAGKLRAVSAGLHSNNSSSGAQSLGLSTSVDFPSLSEQAAQDHRGLAAEYDRLLSEIRINPGFEDFMLPRKASDFFRVANDNPVIVIHAHEPHCGALALLPGYPHVHHIPLPSMTYDKAETARNQLRMSLRRRGVRERSDLRGVKQLGQKNYFKSVLATLWTDVVKPILQELGYMLYPTTELPHITWCTTGPFSFLPIHAAGYYDRPMSKLSDYAISSYTPTLTALLTIEHNDAQPLSSVLAVGQETTPNKSPLPQTVNELDRIKSRATQSETGYMQLDKDGATVSRVLDALGSYSCVHLACHAHQNLVNPLESGFYLHDGTLTLHTIMQQSFQGKQLAFLSACQTAAGDDQIPDEAVHLASGMLVAGYPSVIATMWSISDYYAPLVADEVYERLMNYGSFKPGATAKALHYAVAKLREEVGDDDFIRWVPYVHFGI